MSGEGIPMDTTGTVYVDVDASLPSLSSYCRPSAAADAGNAGNLAQFTASTAECVGTNVTRLAGAWCTWYRDRCGRLVDSKYVHRWRDWNLSVLPFGNFNFDFSRDARAGTGSGLGSGRSSVFEHAMIE